LKLISKGNVNSYPEIASKVNNRKTKPPKFKSQFSTNNTIQMQYNNGDQLLLKGYSGGNITYFTIVPSQTQPVNFEFIQCEDLVGNNYPVVNIGTQTWMARNLNYDPNTGNSTCYNDNPTNCEIYGRLYDWAKLMNGEGSSNSVPSGIQGLCPSGWHIPSDGEWSELVNFLGGEFLAGGSMKNTGTNLWDSPNLGATNSSGFTAFPAGAFTTIGSFANLGSGTTFWSTTEVSGVSNARIRSLTNNSANLFDQLLVKQPIYLAVVSRINLKLCINLLNNAWIIH